MGCRNRYIIVKVKKLLTVDVVWCPVYRETIKIRVPILWFWAEANAPTQETQHIKGSVSHRKRLNMCPNLLHLFYLRSLSLLVSVYLVLPSVFPLSSCFCPDLFLFLLLHPFLHLWLFSVSPLPPSLTTPLLSLSSSASLSIHPTESHPSSLGRHMCCFDSKGSDGARGRKAATP